MTGGLSHVIAGLSNGTAYTFTVKASNSVGLGPASTPSNSVAPVAALALNYVHADHLGTPRAITRPSDNAVLWKWDNTEPFGNNQPNENPSGLGAFKFNLRFPGQYADVETNTNYNYFRDYDSEIGRYIQSDPIGLKGGINTFLYGGGGPLGNSDPRGLDPPAGAVNLEEVVKPGLEYLRKKIEMCTPDDCGSNPLIIEYKGICKSGDEMCSKAMSAAGIGGRYYPETVKYSKLCLAKVGIGAKVTLSAGSTLLLKKLVSVGVPGAAGVAAVANHPAVMAAGAVPAIDALLEHCKCKEQQN